MRTLIPIYFDGEITTEEARQIFEQAGYHVRSDPASGHLIASRIPAFLRKVDPRPTPANVVRLDRRPGVRRRG